MTSNYVASTVATTSTATLQLDVTLTEKQTLNFMFVSDKHIGLSTDTSLHLFVVILHDSYVCGYCGNKLTVYNYLGPSRGSTAILSCSQRKKMYGVYYHYLFDEYRMAMEVFVSDSRDDFSTFYKQMHMGFIAADFCQVTSLVQLVR